LEAMATGAVAVATDVGGCRELVTSGETGLLVPTRAPAAVATAMGRVLRDRRAPARGGRLLGRRDGRADDGRLPAPAPRDAGPCDRRRRVSGPQGCRV